MGISLDYIRDALCETCMFSDQCDGWEYAPYCMNPTVELLKEEADPQLKDKEALPESKWLKIDGSKETGIDDTLYEYLTELCLYLTDKGYQFDIEEIFSAIPHMDGTFNFKELIKMFVVHGREESKNFESDYASYQNMYFHSKDKLHENKAKQQDLSDSYQKRRQEISSKLSDLKKKRDRMDEKSVQAALEKDLEKAKAMAKRHAGIKDLDECLKQSPSLLNFVKIVERTVERPAHDILMDELKKAARLSIRKRNSKEIMDAAKERAALIDRSRQPEYTDREKALNDKKIRDEEKRLQDEERRFQKEMSVIIKDGAKIHRERFVDPHNAVQSTSSGESAAGKLIEKMTSQDKKNVLNYINDNVKRFRTRLTRKIRSENRHTIDLPETVRKACATNGIPLKIQYKKPERQKANLVMILDVSGSCSNASELMLYFMYAMKGAFPGGCRTYVFTNRLYDISEFFKASDPSQAVSRILASIPRSGAYSNYEVPLKEIYENHMSEITKDSLIYFIGDARNNKNKSGTEYLKQIARRGRKAYWLNTEPKEHWNTGDSVMSEYAKYMDKVAEIRTPKQLMDFISN